MATHTCSLRRGFLATAVFIHLFAAHRAFAQVTPTAFKDSAALADTTLPEVTVQATRARPGSGATYTYVSGKTLRRVNLGQDVPYLLQATPSAVASSDAGTGIGYTGLRIRGSDPTRTNVTLNGVPVNDAESQGTYWVDLPDLAASVQSVQVVRGVGASTNGAAAFGGSLNVATRALADSAYGEASGAAGSFGTLRQSLAFGSGKIGKGFYVEGRASAIRSDGYIERAAADLRSLYGVAGYKGRRGQLRLLVLDGSEKTYQAWYGVPQDSLATHRRLNLAGTDFGLRLSPYYNETDNYRQTYYQLQGQARLGARWQGAATAFLTKGAGYYEQYKVADAYNPLSDYTLPPYVQGADTAYSTDVIRRRWLRNGFYGMVATATRQTDRLRVDVGASATQYDGASFGRLAWTQLPIPGADGLEYYRSPSRKQELSGFAKAYYTAAPGLTIYADAQARGINYKIWGTESGQVPVDVAQRYLFINPKAGADYILPGGVHVSAGIAVAHREPTRTSFIEAAGRTPARPERLVDYELTARRGTALWSWEITAYHMAYKDQLIATGELTDVGNTVLRNVPSSYRQGVEVQATLKPARWVEAYGALTLSRNRLKASTDSLAYYNADGARYDTGIAYRNAPLAFSPQVIANYALTLRPMPGLELTLPGRYISAQYLDNTGSADRRLPAYWVQDTRLALAPKALAAKLGLRELRLTLQCNNVLDVKYASNGYTYFILGSGGANQPLRAQSYNYLFPQAGRSYLVGVVVGI